MATNIPKICWDSCVFIDGHQKTSGRYEHIKRIEDEARAKNLRIVVSTLGIAEVVKFDGELLPEDAERQIREYFENEWVSIIQVDRAIAKSAAKIVRDHRVKPPDAIHIATALRCRAAALCTYDEASGLLPLDREIEGLRIIKPDDYGNKGEGELFGRL